MSTALYNAAVSLETELAGYVWFRMIGVGLVNGMEGIIVYVSDNSQPVEHRIPMSWDGFPVTHRKMSQPVPISGW